MNLKRLRWKLTGWIFPLGVNPSVANRELSHIWTIPCVLSCLEEELSLGEPNTGLILVICREEFPLVQINLSEEDESENLSRP